MSGWDEFGREQDMAAARSAWALTVVLTVLVRMACG